ncbi:HAMP domain-containing sensor histidine kinase [Clostridiaceae bacterium M8S5]|nr:HAMP domain-containing sensor histidine kinase [Clostridiaceae bacterium M8S5]
MELVIIILFIVSVYFSARFFLVYRNIEEITKDFKEITEDIETNRKLTLAYPDKKLEKLLISLNEHLTKTQLQRIRYIKREEEIKKDIENISHDLRTPLTSIRGYIELINDENTTQDEIDEYVSVIERKAVVLQNLIEAFYDLSRLEVNDYKMNLEVIDINKELRELLLVFYNDFEKKNISVDIKISSQKSMVKLDKTAIQRVFNNLIQNAIKYSQTSFKVESDIGNKNIIITFINDIQDINEDEAKLLFKRFYMKNSSRNNQSSGLGLTITKLLVENMGGNIEVKVEQREIVFKLSFALE